jgi:hypothetical protein
MRSCLLLTVLLNSLDPFVVTEFYCYDREGCNQKTNIEETETCVLILKCLIYGR